MTFYDLKLAKPIVLALESMGYTSPTPIQQQAIPVVLRGADIFGCAQTGTGKTGAFAIPILQQLHNKQSGGGIRALILAPTRELALQISESVSTYGKHLRVSHATVYGGVPKNKQARALRNQTDILIATPGRLLDLMADGVVKLDKVEHFVLDEADRMLDMGFINDIRKVIAKLPAQRQTLFFSATVTPPIKKLSDSLLKNPVHISVTPVSSTSPLVEQRIYYVSKENKRSLLNHVLTTEKVEHALVFTRTKRGADKVVKDLTKAGISSQAIHGNKSQAAREKALKGFKSKTIRVLVATDIASRGIDISMLSHVINYEIPEQPETYVHRIGRTGRAGATGQAMSFCTREEMGYMKEIHKLNTQKIEVVASHPFV